VGPEPNAPYSDTSRTGCQEDFATWRDDEASPTLPAEGKGRGDRFALTGVLGS